jgi:hypothetical protein
MGRRKDEKLERVWRGRLAKFRRSEMTVTEFCRREGVSTPSFYQWRKRLGSAEERATRSAGEDRPGPTEPGSFVPLIVSAPLVAEIEFPNGMRVRVPATNGEALRVAIAAGAEAFREVSSC